MLRINKILYPTDFSRCANQVFPRALSLAKEYKAELHMLHAIVLNEDDPYNPAYHFPDVDEIHTKLEEFAIDKMDSVIESYRADEIVDRKVQIRGIAPSSVILEYANSNDIDLIVMGTHGRRGVGRLLLGSVAEKIVHFAQCPVMTIRESKEPKPMEKINRILVPIDFSGSARSALTYAKEIASSFDAKLQILHVIDDFIQPFFYMEGRTSILDAKEEIDIKAKKVLAKLLKVTSGPDVIADIHVIKGNATRDIVKFAEKNNSELIVIATHGLTGIEHLLMGSVTEKVVRLAPCPVLTIKPFGKSLL